MFTLIVNSIAGHGKALKVAEQIKTELSRRGADFEIVYTEYAGHATELARACAERGDAQLFCIGGDGTAFEVANGIIGTNTALGIIPGGTGNDFVRALGLPKDPAAALDALLAAPTKAVNVCQLNDRVFLNVCGSGFDVEVVRASDRAKRFFRGMIPYLYGVLHTIFTYQPRTFTLEIDGEAQTVPLLLVAVANGQYIGGGMHIAPMARLDDDLLDVITIRWPSRWRIPFLLPKFIDGSFIQLKDLVEHRRCREVRIASPGMKMQLDGEIVPVEDARLRIGQSYVTLMMPAK